jgi:hypothetical protein
MINASWEQLSKLKYHLFLSSTCMPETILSQLHQHAWSSNLRPELNNQGQFYKMLEQSFIFFNGIMHIFFGCRNTALRISFEVSELM